MIGIPEWLHRQTAGPGGSSFRRGGWGGLAVAAVVLWATTDVFAADTGPAPSAPGVIDKLPIQRNPGDPWCHYRVARGNNKQAGLRNRAAKVVTLSEIEPNDFPAQARLLNVSSTIGQEVDVDLRGNITPGADLDYYRISIRKGDVIGIAVIADPVDPPDPRLPPPLDPVVGIYDLSGNLIIENDDDYGLTGLYPVDSPLPKGDYPLDSALSWIAIGEGEYLVRVSSFASSRNGKYTLRIVARRPYLETQASNVKQILFIDFDGAVDVNAYGLFGSGAFSATLSSLRAFLPRWGLGLEDEATVVQAIIDTVQSNFDKLRLASLNGDRPVDQTPGHFDVEIRNSRDNPDPFGQPNVSRIIVGGTIFQLGIATLGIAESIDPGNFNTAETGVVLLDFLSGPAGSLDSINSIPLAPGTTIIDAIGRVVGNIVTHEAGHYLGLWHTDNENEIDCLIDRGGNGIFDEAGVGPDGVLGTADDVDVDFVPDVYHPLEGVAVGTEFTDTRVAFALSTGRFDIITPPPPVEVPRASISTIPSAGSAPLTVQLFGGGTPLPGDPFVVFNWDFGDGTGASGAFVTHTYTTPGYYLATLAAISSEGKVAVASSPVSVTATDNTQPVPRIVANPRTGPAPLRVLFEAVAFDLDGAVVRYEWQFGDGTTASGRNVEHVYVDVGAYGVVVNAFDDRGARGMATTVIRATSGVSATASEVVTAPQTPSATAAPSCAPGIGGAATLSLMSLLGVSVARRRFRQHG